MIDVALLRQDPARIQLLKKKDPLFDVQRLLALDERTRQLNVSIEQLRARRNELARQASAGVTPELRQESIALGQELKEREKEYHQVADEFHDLILRCPNIPGSDLPEGGKEANRVVSEHGKKAVFTFPIKNHVELGRDLGWFDFEAAARMSAAQFALYRGDAVRLMYALTCMMLKNNVAHGFQPILPPYVVNAKSLEAASNFPRFRDQVYEIVDHDLFLTPTAEVNLTNLYRDTILSLEQLPVRLTAWTSCFRREAGGYGAHERGLIRIHEFEKVELYSIVEPEKSEQELEYMRGCAEKILQTLGLHYRVSLLAAQDCSFASAKTYDLEVWMPGQNAYYEVSSCSNCTDFQARRAAIRFRREASGKTILANTLNASSLALPRLMVALMETYQQPDGSIALPECLHKYMPW